LAEAAFRARVAELGGVVLGEYRGSRYAVPCRCAAGHDCRPRPDHVQQGKGICRTCAVRDPDVAEAAFRARVAELGGVVLGDYCGNQRPVLCRCAAGHECSPLPHNVLRGRGLCWACRGRAWDTFYVVEHASAFRIKFGITSICGHSRLRDHRAAGYTRVVRLMAGLPGDTAPEIERAVIAALALAGERPVRGREYYDVSALALVLDVADNYPTGMRPTAAGATP
jgi:hypothetical protein